MQNLLPREVDTVPRQTGGSFYDLSAMNSGQDVRQSYGVPGACCNGLDQVRILRGLT